MMKTVISVLACVCVAACSTPGYRALNPSCIEDKGLAKYQRDGHQDTTYIVAVLAGRSPREAALLSFYNQAADDLAQHKLVMIQLQFKQIEYKDLYKIGEEIAEMNIDENLLNDLDEDNNIDARDQFQPIEAGDDMYQFDANQMNMEVREEYENEMMEIDHVYNDEDDEPPDGAFIL